MRGILKKQGYGDGSVGKAFSCACLHIRVQIPRTQEKLDAGVHICHPSAPATKWSVETGGGEGCPQKLTSQLAWRKE